MRLSFARSVRLALLGLTLVLSVAAGLGVARLYAGRQRYENRLAGAGQLEVAASRMLAAGVVEEATLRTQRGLGAALARARARAAFEQAAAAGRRLAVGDAPSRRLTREAIAAQARLRASPGRAGSALAARAPLVALAARQRDRIARARADARRDSRRALLFIGVGGALGLATALALVGALLGALRRPLASLVDASGRLAAGDLRARVPEEGPAELRALAASFNDMADQLEGARERLEAERHRLAVTIESLGDALVVADRHGVVVAANPRAGELVPNLAPGARVADADLPPVADAARREVTVERDHRTLAVNAARLGGGEEIVWTVRDVTERARLERLKTEFVATASHELRSPLTSIKGFLELLAGTDLDRRQREFADIALVSTNRLVDMVNDLLDVARVEAGRVEIHRRPTDLGHVVHEVAALMAPRVDDKRQRLDVDVPVDLPRAMADPARVRQILTNLVTNAHLYTDAGGTLAVRARAVDGHVELEVADSGRGMDAEQLTQVWDRFYRAPGTDTPGTGLGLSIVRSLVELHGGTVDVDSAPDAGTTFTVRLPRAGGQERPAHPRLALRGRRVLVVDDEPETARLIAERLEPFGVHATTVHDGPAALAALRDGGRFDAMTLDILMPGMSGFEVLRELRADPRLRATPVVVVSVFSGREALSGEWVVSKPIDARELVDALGAAVLAGRVRVLVVARAELRGRVERMLRELGVEHRWATSPEQVQRLCANLRFEVALVDAGAPDPQSTLGAIRLRGRRLRHSVVVFSAGDGADGLARLDADPVSIDDAGAAVVALLEGRAG